MISGAGLNVTRLTLEMCNGVYFYTSYAHHMASKFYRRLNKFHLSARFINGISYGLQLNFEDTTRYENYKGVLNLFTKRWKIILVIIVNIGLREKKKTRSPNILPRSWEKKRKIRATTILPDLPKSTSKLFTSSWNALLCCTSQ